VIQKPEQHETDRAAKRLLRESLEPHGWVVDNVEEDYRIASNVQVFDGKSPSGAWFHDGTGLRKRFEKFTLAIL
jgi:hypothetical protein